MKVKLAMVVELSFLATLVLSIITIFPMSLVYASPGPTIYLSPSNYIFNTSNATIGTKFNVTVWVSNPTYPFGVRMWQVYLTYDQSMINVTEFYGKVTKAPSFRAWPNNNLKGRDWSTDYIFYGEVGGGIGNPFWYNLGTNSAALKWGDVIGAQVDVPSAKKLGAIEFQIIKLPPEGDKLFCSLGINNVDTLLYDDVGKVPGVSKIDGYYEFSSGGPPPPPPPPAQTKIYVDPPEIINPTMQPSSTFTIDITIDDVANLTICEFNLTYNTNVLSWISIMVKKIMDQYPTTTLTLDEEAGWIWTRLSYATPITTSSPLVLATIGFHVDDLGESPLNLHSTQLTNSTAQPITHETSGGFFSNLMRDVAIVNVVRSRSWAYHGWPVNITVTAKNLGNKSETFDVKAYYDSNLIGALPIVGLAPGAEINVTITWNTTGVPEGTYTIKGEATTVPYEINTANNIFIDGTVEIKAFIHDVAIINVIPSRGWVFQGNPLNITVTAKNLGNFTETFDVKAYYDSNLIGALPIVGLAPGAEINVTFTWNTTDVEPCHNYTIKGEATAVSFEFNMTNNIYIDGKVKVRFVGDVDGDGKVDMVDMWEVAQAFGSYPGHPRWNPGADINGDNIIDMVDLWLIAHNFGKACSP